MRGAIRPPSIRLHGVMLSATQILFLSASLPVRPTRLAAGSLPSRPSPETADTWTGTASFCASTHLAGWQSTVCIIDRAIKYCCSWNVFPCNRLYRYRLLETPTHHNRYYRTGTVISFWSVHVKSFWCALTSLVRSVQLLL